MTSMRQPSRLPVHSARREGLNGEGGNVVDESYLWADWASIFSITIALEPPRL
jgi:hypothetical protein